MVKFFQHYSNDRTLNDFLRSNQIMALKGNNLLNM